jgi:hypothetical protein
MSITKQGRLRQSIRRTRQAKVLVRDGRLNVAVHRTHGRGLFSFRITSRAEQSVTAD